MAMTAGTVTIAADGGETKTGAAEALYDLMKSQATTDLLAFGQAFPTGADGVAVKRALAKQANLFASWMVTYITANAKAQIPNSAAGDGLQRTPNPNVADAETQRPSATKLLSIV